MTEPFFTIGHSTRTLEEFIELLRKAEVTALVDVRRLPGSRRHPQFNEDSLAEALPQAGIHYERLLELTGRRGRSRDVPEDVNGFWENRSFHNYADYALSDEFRRGLSDLRERGRRTRTTVMCSEAVWWRCHRRLISDNLLAQGETVFHILSPGRTDPARLTEGALVHDDRTVTYPPASASADAAPARPDR